MSAVIAAPLIFMSFWINSELGKVNDTLKFLTAEVQKVGASAAQSAASSASSEKVSRELFSRIEKLVVAIARGNARMNEPGKTVAFYRVLPREMYGKMIKAGKLDRFLYTNFDGTDWFFVEQANFNLLTSDEQRVMKISIEQYDARLEVE